MHAISSYRDDRPTNKQTNKHTHTARGDYNTLRSLARSVTKMKSAATRSTYCTLFYGEIENLNDAR